MLGLLSYYIRANLYHAGDCCTIDGWLGGAGEVGSALIRSVMSRAQAGCAEISVGTMPDNVRAIALPPAALPTKRCYWSNTIGTGE